MGSAGRCRLGAPLWAEDWTVDSNTHATARALNRTNRDRIIISPSWTAQDDSRAVTSAECPFSDVIPPPIIANEAVIRKKDHRRGWRPRQLPRSVNHRR